MFFFLSNYNFVIPLQTEGDFTCQRVDKRRDVFPLELKEYNQWKILVPLLKVWIILFPGVDKSTQSYLYLLYI